MHRDDDASSRRRRDHKKWSRRGARLLTAATVASSLPLTSDAFGTTSSSSLPHHPRAPSFAGPLHASLAGYEVSSRRVETMATTMATRGVIPPPVASTVVPSTSFLLYRQKTRATVISIPAAGAKYGGRASGTTTEGAAGSRRRTAESSSLLASQSQRRRVGGTALGFVVLDEQEEDADGVSSSTRLSVSASSRSGGSASRHAPSPADTLGRTGSSRSSSSVDGGGGGMGGSSGTIRPVRSAASSPIKKRVAASLYRSSGGGGYSYGAISRPGGKFGDGSSSMVDDGRSDNRRVAGGTADGTTTKKHVYVVPAWFPWIPTRSQIEALKVAELRGACVERALAKTGRKEELQHRLADWTTEQHRRRVGDRRSGRAASGILGTGSSSSGSGGSAKSRTPLDDMIDRALEPGDVSSSSSSVGEIEPLINRRKALRRSKDVGSGRKDGAEEEKEDNTCKRGAQNGARSPPFTDAVDDDDDDLEDDCDDDISASAEALPAFTPTREYLSSLREAFNSPTSKFSNYEVKEMYLAAKFADQAGDGSLSRRILTELLEATPNDSRVVRRLARSEVEVGNVSGARRILQNGIRRNQGDAHLLQGLAALELRSGDVDAARGLFKEAIRADPAFPNPYHALGTLEHSRGNIRVATTVLRHGLRACPANHRLHHALGDLYREARMIGPANLAYRKALECSPEWGRPFAYTALSYLAYEKGDGADCHRWLQEGLEVNGGMHSQGWLALAQLEESEGRIDAARRVYKDALKRYERKRIQRSVVPRSLAVRYSGNDNGASVGTPREDAGRNGSSRGNKSLVRPSRSGDKWIFVYKSWARMEEHHGTYESADAVYTRATRAYPSNSALFLGWAQLQAKHGHHQRAKSLFEAACNKAGSRSADPYRVYAEFEMSLQNYSRARSILYLGAQAISESSDGGAGKSDDFAHLFHTWAVCEWHLSNLDRAEVLFDHALRLTDAGKKGSEIRSLILYSIARFLFDARREYVLAQHCVCLSLKENVTPGGNSQIWHLWSEIARSLKNENLADRCKDQAETLGKEEDGGAGTDLSRLLGLRRSAAASADSSSSSLPMMTGPAMQKMLKKEPWHHKLAGTSVSKKSSWYEGVNFPELSVSDTAEAEVETS